MQAKEHKQLVEYLSKGRFPKAFKSTKSNFVKKARKFELNADGKLCRDEHPVVLLAERKRIFKCYHQHR